MSDNNTELRVTLKADGAELVDAVQGARKEVDALTKSTAALSQGSSKMASEYSGLSQAVKMNGAAVSDTDSEVGKLLDRYDPLGAKLRQLQADFKALDQAASSGRIAGRDDARVDTVYTKLNQQISSAKTLLVQAGNAGEQGFAKITGGAEKAGVMTAGVTREMIVLGHEALTGNFSRIPGTLMVMAERVGGLGGAMMALAPLVAAVAAVAVAGAAAWESYGSSIKGIREELAKLDAALGLQTNGQLNKRFDELGKQIDTLREKSSRGGWGWIQAAEEAKVYEEEQRKVGKQIDANKALEIKLGDVAGIASKLSRESATAKRREIQRQIDLLQIYHDKQKAGTQAEIDSQSKLDELRKSLIVKPGRTAHVATGALLGADRAGIEAEMMLLKDGLSRAARAYDMALQDRTISLRDYYQAKTTLEQQAIDAEIQRTQALLATQQRMTAAGRTENDRLRAKGAVSKLEADLIVLNNRRADVEITNSRKAAAAEKSLADELQRVRDELNAMTGQSGDRRAAIERQFADLKDRLGNDAAGLALVDKLIDVKAADANLSDLEKRWRLAVENMRNAQAAIQIQQQTGLLTEAQARKQIVILQQQASAEMAQLLPAMEKAATAIGPEAVARVAAWKNELARTKLVVDDVAVAINGQAQNAFATMFEDIATGAQNASSAFATMTRSILAAIAKIASQKLAESLFSSMGGSGGSGGIGGLITSMLFSSGMADGGLVSGPGTATSDSIPVRLSAGEFVMKASAVQRLGVGFMHALNGGFSLPSSIGSSLGFAAGGLVPNAAPATQATQGVRIVNVIDPSMAGEYMSSPAGEKVLLNVLSRNGGVIKNILAGA